MGCLPKAATIQAPSKRRSLREMWSQARRQFDAHKRRTLRVLWSPRMDQGESRFARVRVEVYQKRVGRRIRFFYRQADKLRPNSWA